MRGEVRSSVSHGVWGWKSSVSQASMRPLGQCLIVCPAASICPPRNWPDVHSRTLKSINMILDHTYPGWNLGVLCDLGPVTYPLWPLVSYQGHGVGPECLGLCGQCSVSPRGLRHFMTFCDPLRTASVSWVHLRQANPCWGQWELFPQPQSIEASGSMRTDFPTPWGSLVSCFPFSLFFRPIVSSGLHCPPVVPPVLMPRTQQWPRQTKIPVLVGLMFQWKKQKIKLSVHKEGVSFDCVRVIRSWGAPRLGSQGRLH